MQAQPFRTPNPLYDKSAWLARNVATADHPGDSHNLTVTTDGLPSSIIPLRSTPPCSPPMSWTEADVGGVQDGVVDTRWTVE